MQPEKRFNIKCQGETNHAKCKALTANIHDARRHAIMYFKNYVRDYEECTNAMEALRNSLRCASCDANNMYLIKIINTVYQKLKIYTKLDKIIVNK